jgi:hypothetical protein
MPQKQIRRCFIDAFLMALGAERVARANLRARCVSTNIKSPQYESERNLRHVKIGELMVCANTSVFILTEFL